MVDIPIILMLEWLKQEHPEFEDSLNDMKPYLKKKPKKPMTEED